MTANHLELCAYFRCFVFRCGFVLVNFIYVIQGNLTDASYHCSGATEATLTNIGKYIIWIHNNLFYNQSYKKHKVPCANLMRYTVFLPFHYSFHPEISRRWSFRLVFESPGLHCSNP